MTLFRRFTPLALGPFALAVAVGCGGPPPADAGTDPEPDTMLEGDAGPDPMPDEADLVVLVEVEGAPSASPTVTLEYIDGRQSEEVAVVDGAARFEEVDWDFAPLSVTAYLPGHVLSSVLGVDETRAEEPIRITVPASDRLVTASGTLVAAADEEMAVAYYGERPVMAEPEFATDVLAGRPFWMVGAAVSDFTYNAASRSYSQTVHRLGATRVPALEDDAEVSISLSDEMIQRVSYQLVVDNEQAHPTFSTRGLDVSTRVGDDATSLSTSAGFAERFERVGDATYEVDMAFIHPMEAHVQRVYTLSEPNGITRLFIDGAPSAGIEHVSWLEPARLTPSSGSPSWDDWMAVEYRPTPVSRRGPT
jgi:hypothetical protein